MTLNEFNIYLNSFLHNENYLNDVSLNGIQIQNSLPNSKQIKKVAFSVDACVSSCKEAFLQKADVLVTHHGILWGSCQRITDSFYSKVSEFIKNDIALISYHIPLDANNPFGNNFGMANKLGLKNLENFGFWKNMTIGVKGEFENPKTLEEIKNLIFEQTQTDCKLYKFGKEKIKTVGYISGGAGEDVEQAAKENLDLFITGEFLHSHFHLAEELKINVISAGHYGTEKMGVELLKEKVEKDLGLQTVFIDLPTNL